MADFIQLTKTDSHGNRYEGKILVNKDMILYMQENMSISGAHISTIIHFMGSEVWVKETINQISHVYTKVA